MCCDRVHRRVGIQPGVQLTSGAARSDDEGTIVGVLVQPDMLSDTCSAESVDPCMDAQRATVVRQGRGIAIAGALSIWKML